jgi:hypothetical protein
MTREQGDPLRSARAENSSVPFPDPRGMGLGTTRTRRRPKRASRRRTLAINLPKRLGYSPLVDSARFSWRART